MKYFRTNNYLQPTPQYAGNSRCDVGVTDAPQPPSGGFRVPKCVELPESASTEYLYWVYRNQAQYFGVDRTSLTRYGKT